MSVMVGLPKVVTGTQRDESEGAPSTRCEAGVGEVDGLPPRGDQGP